MTASHFLRHLAIAYRHFHPLDEHRKFSDSVGLFERNQLRQRLEELERRCELAMLEGRDVSSLMQRIREIKSDVFSH